MEDHTAYIYVVCLPLPDGAFFFFSIHKAHTFAQPDTFCKVWKRLGNAVPIGKLGLVELPHRGLIINMAFRVQIHFLYHTPLTRLRYKETHIISENRSFPVKEIRCQLNHNRKLCEFFQQLPRCNCTVVACSTPNQHQTSTTADLRYVVL